ECGVKIHTCRGFRVLYWDLDCLSGSCWLSCYDGLLGLDQLHSPSVQSMRQAMFTKPIRGFLLGKVLARTGTINLMIDGLAIGLAGNTAFAIYDFHQTIQS